MAKHVVWEHLFLLNVHGLGDSPCSRGVTTKETILAVYSDDSYVLVPCTFVQSVTGKTREEIALEVQDMSWGTFKPLLAEATVEHLVSNTSACFR